MDKREGLTLIEVIVSMALIGMIAVIFLTIFNTGNKNIFKAGKRTDDTLAIQEVVDIFIENPKDTEKEFIYFINKNFVDRPDILEKMYIEISDEPKLNIINVEIEGIEVPVSVPGKYITIKQQTEKQKGIEITTFVPDKD